MIGARHSQEAVTQISRSAETGGGRWFYAQALGLKDQGQMIKQGLVFYREHPRQQGSHGVRSQHRCAGHSQPISLGLVTETQVINRRMTSRRRQQVGEKAGRLHRLSKIAVHMVTQDLVQAPGNAGRCAAYAAGQVDQQRMLRIHHDTSRLQLAAQGAGPLRCNP